MELSDKLELGTIKKSEFIKLMKSQGVTKNEAKEKWKKYRIWIKQNRV